MPSAPATPADLPGGRRYDLVVFDLDGTLADSFGFFVAVHHRLAQRHAFATLGPHQIEAMRDWSTQQILRHTGLPAWRLPAVVRDFRQLMHEEGGAVACFPGVPDVLAALHASGLRLALVSSNSLENCRRVLGEDNWQRLEHVECGASLFGKARRLRRVLARTGIAPGRAIYVGDQTADSDAARQAGVAFGAVAWGYASAAALEAAGAPDARFVRIDDLNLLAGTRTG